MCGEFTEKYQQGQTHQAKVTMVGSDDATTTFNSFKQQHQQDRICLNLTFSVYRETQIDHLMASIRFRPAFWEAQNRAR